jgi:cellulose synthase/poly-beta-1,6-N-acetylglucosamine synthase-like glycosyltransferase
MSPPHMSSFALLAMLLLAYTYAGYPLLVATWAFLFPCRLRKDDEFEPTISICMAVFNGGPWLEAKLASLQRLEYPPDKIAILVCSDGSTDDTARIVERLAASDPRIVLLENSTRLGKPASVNRLRRSARGDVLLMTDVRQLLAPATLRALIRPLADPSVGCVSGRLVLAGHTGAGAYWRYERFIRTCEGRIGSMVGVSGSIYALWRRDLPDLPEDLILDDMFVPLRIALSKRHVVFCEEAEAYDLALDDEHEFARKVRTLAGNYQLLAKMPSLLIPGTRVWFHVMSHKLLRLVCPFALLVLFSTSLGIALAPLPEISLSELHFWRALSLAQFVLYALALFGGRAGRVAGLMRTFVVLNAAAVVGLWRFVRKTQAVTW